MASSRSVRAGRAHVEFFLEDSPLRRGLTLAERRMRQFGASVQNIGRKAFTAGLGGIAAFALPMKQMMDFDDAIRMTGAVSQSSAEQLESLRQTALELGRTTSFTAVQVASLMGELGRAGFKPDEINAMTAAVLNLSRASGTDATLSAGIMAATLRQFSMGASEATRVANVLTLAANSTFNSVESLGEALSYAGPVAADLGMTLEDTVAILGTLGNVGIQGSNAGTALRRISTMTAAEAEKMKKIFGVSFLDASGNVRPLITVMGELAESTNSLPTGERIARMNEAFGLLGITGASVMATAAANTTELANSLRQAGTVAADTAENMDAGPGGTWRILTSAVEGASIAIGTALAPQFQRLGGWITEATGKLTTWITQNEGLIVSAARASGYMLAGGAALIVLGKGLQVAAIGATILNAGLGVVSIGLSAVTGLLSLGAGAAGLVATTWGILSAATASGTIAYSIATGAVAAFQIAVLTLTSTTAVAAIVSGAMEAATIAGSVAYSLATAAIVVTQIALMSLSSALGIAAVTAAAMEVATLAGSVAYSVVTAAIVGAEIALISLVSSQVIAASSSYGLASAQSALNAIVGLGSVAYTIAASAVYGLTTATGICNGVITAASVASGIASGAITAFELAVISLASAEGIAAIASGAMNIAVAATGGAYAIASSGIAIFKAALTAVTTTQGLAAIASYGLSAAQTVATSVFALATTAAGTLAAVVGLATSSMTAASIASGILASASAASAAAHTVASVAAGVLTGAITALSSVTSIAAIATTAMEIATIAGSVAYSLATAAIAGVQVALIALASGQAAATIATYALAAANAIANGVLAAGAIAYSLITWAVSMFQIALLTLASAEGITAVATAVLSGALSALGAVLVFMTSPAGIILAGIVAIGAAAGMIGNPITALTGLIGGAASAFSSMAGQIMQTASMLMDVYGPAWDLIVAKIGSGDLAGAMRFAWELTKASFSLGIAYIQQAWGSFSDWFSVSVQDTMLTISDIWGTVWDNVVGIAQYAIAKVKDAWNSAVDFSRSLMGLSAIDRGPSNVSKVAAEQRASEDARAQQSLDQRAELQLMLKGGEAERQAAVDAQLAKINELISTEKKRMETPPPPSAPPQTSLPPAQQALANTLSTGTQAAMTARAEAIVAVDKNTSEGQKAIYELLDQSGKKDETVGAIGSLETTLVDEFERTRREDRQAPRLAGSRQS
jgi:TP901 family phage tail tape measure protein